MPLKKHLHNFLSFADCCGALGALTIQGGNWCSLERMISQDGDILKVMPHERALKRVVSERAVFQEISLLRG